MIVFAERELICVVNLCWLGSELSSHCHDRREPLCPRRHLFPRFCFSSRFPPEVSSQIRRHALASGDSERPYLLMAGSHLQLAREGRW